MGKVHCLCILSALGQLPLRRIQCQVRAGIVRVPGNMGLGMILPGTSAWRFGWSCWKLIRSMEPGASEGTLDVGLARKGAVRPGAWDLGLVRSAWRSFGLEELWPGQGTLRPSRGWRTSTCAGSEQGPSGDDAVDQPGANKARPARCRLGPLGAWPGALAGSAGRRVQPSLWLGCSAGGGDASAHPGPSRGWRMLRPACCRLRPKAK